jgi:type IV secretion system protein VirD4
LLTPGEMMQLPPADEIVMLAGTPPIRAKKARYFEDMRLAERVLSPPTSIAPSAPPVPDGWSAFDKPRSSAGQAEEVAKTEDASNGGLRREPELPDHVAILKETSTPSPRDEFAGMDDEPEDAARQARTLRQQLRGLARQASLDPADGYVL